MAKKSRRSTHGRTRPRPTSTRAAGTRPRARKRARAIPAKQLRLPAGYHAGSRKPASLKQVIDPATPTDDGVRLDAEQRQKLTLQRIKQQRSFTFLSLGGPKLSKRRALAEVRELTPLGEALIDIEHRAIELMRELAEKQRGTRRTGPEKGAKAAPKKGGKPAPKKGATAARTAVGSASTRKRSPRRSTRGATGESTKPAKQRPGRKR